MFKQVDDGTSVGDVCSKAAISEATYYNWRKKYAGLMPSEMRGLRQPEDENSKLRKLVAGLSLDEAMLQDVVSRKLWSLIDAPAGSRGPQHMAGQHLAGLQGASGRTIQLPLSWLLHRSGRPRTAHLGDRPDAGSLRP